MVQRSKATSPKPLAKSATASPPVSETRRQPHELECLIQRSLQTHDGLKFSRLTVHQCEQGVCLEGLLETNELGVDLCDLVNQIADVKVINRVVTCPTIRCGE